jgi:hypothetical protein
VADGVRVRGLGDLNRALRRTDRDVRLSIRKELRDVAEPVRADAESRADSRIRNLDGDWTRMRTGATTNSVYVAPKLRGSKKGPQKRPNLAPLLMDRAMQPALQHHAPQIEREFDEMLGRVTDNFSKG